MDEKPLPSRVLTFGLATFHTVFFIMIPVVFLYTRGTLGALLEGLNTLAGYVIFGALWGTTWWTTRKALRGYYKRSREDGGENWTAEVLEGEFALARITINGIIWGGVNGFLFLIAFGLIFQTYVLILKVAELLGGHANPYASITLIPFVLIGSPVGVIVGGVLGFVLALVDTVVLGFVRRLY